MAQRRSRGSDRRGRDRRDRLAAGAARQRQAAARAAGRRPGANSRDRRRTCGGGTSKQATHGRPRRPWEVVPAYPEELTNAAEPAAKPRERPPGRAPLAGATEEVGAPTSAPFIARHCSAAGLLLRPAPHTRRIPDRALVPLTIQVSGPEPIAGLRFGANLAVEVVGGGDDVHSHPTGPLEPVTEQAGA
jgi:hypothetical protein